MNKQFTIKIDNLGLGGFAPSYWATDHPTYGNNNHIADMSNCDLFDPAYITQGYGNITLTNGDEGGNVTTLLKGMLSYAQSSTLTFATGGNKVYTINQGTAVSAVQTINHASKTGEDGEDVAVYGGDLYYSYNHSTGGDIGKFDLSSTYDDDWWTTTAGGSELTDNPHQIAIGGTSGIMWIADGQYVKQWDGATATDDAFNTDDSDSVIESIVWNQDKLYIAANSPASTGGNKRVASIYVWDGYSPNWDYRIEIEGEVGALYVKDGLTYVFYRKNMNSTSTMVGIVQGRGIQELFTVGASLPGYHQVADHKNFLVWAGSGHIYAYGSNSPRAPKRVFQFMEPTNANIGGISGAFGFINVASYAGTSYNVERRAGNTVDSYFETLTFYPAPGHRKVTLSSVYLEMDRLETDGRVDMTIYDITGSNLGQAAYTVSFDNDGAITSKVIPLNAIHASGFYLKFNFVNGSTSGEVKIRSITIRGTAVL